MKKVIKLGNNSLNVASFGTILLCILVQLMAQ